MSSTTLSAVARISYLSSDVVFDVAGAKLHSAFSPLFANFHAYRPPTLISVPNGADLGLRISKLDKGIPLITVVLHAERDVLNRLIPSLSSLTGTPLVIHVAVDEDLSDVLPLQASVDFLIHSATAQLAYDNALLAARLARTESAIVLHVFQTDGGGSFDEVDELKIKPFLAAPKNRTASNGTHANGHGGLETLGAFAEPNTQEDVRITQYNDAALATLALVHRPILPFHYHGSGTIHAVVITLGDSISSNSVPDSTALIELSLVQPLPTHRLLSSIPASVNRAIVLEQIHKWPAKWTPLYLHILSLIQTISAEHRPQLSSGVLGRLPASSQGLSEGITNLFQNAQSTTSQAELVLGALPASSSESATRVPQVPKHESAYTKVLDHVFGDRLAIINSPTLVATQGEVATRPEYALGRAEAHITERSALQGAVESLLAASREIELPQALHTLLAQWLDARSDATRSGKTGQDIIKELEAHNVDHPSVQTIRSLKHQFAFTSQWIIGSDAWSYDLGSSGLHHAIASGLNVNLLILDNTPYTTRNAADPEKRKKDVGLYAMNYGNSYVASVAIYSSYGHVLRTLMEADKFDGPSIVLAYLPYTSEDDSALSILKETKLAVDSGYWPLYRWNPSKVNPAESFSLDSEAIKADLQEFLDRQTHISQLVASEPKLAAELVTSLGSKLAEARSQKASAAYDAMLSGLDGPPLTILYASDGGTAEKYAK
ncbi:hypothetical protein FRC17_003900, partial [Serendipita sp. 399]